jgi:hypothetical protein
MKEHETKGNFGGAQELVDLLTKAIAVYDKANGTWDLEAVNSVDYLDWARDKKESLEDEVKQMSLGSALASLDDEKLRTLSTKELTDLSMPKNYKASGLDLQEQASLALTYAEGMINDPDKVAEAKALTASADTWRGGIKDDEKAKLTMFAAGARLADELKKYNALGTDVEKQMAADPGNILAQGLRSALAATQEAAAKVPGYEDILGAQYPNLQSMVSSVETTQTSIATAQATTDENAVMAARKALQDMGDGGFWKKPEEGKEGPGKAHDWKDGFTGKDIEKLRTQYDKSFSKIVEEELVESQERIESVLGLMQTNGETFGYDEKFKTAAASVEEIQKKARVAQLEMAFFAAWDAYYSDEMKWMKWCVREKAEMEEQKFRDGVTPLYSGYHDILKSEIDKGIAMAPRKAPRKRPLAAAAAAAEKKDAEKTSPNTAKRTKA